MNAQAKRMQIVELLDVLKTLRGDDHIVVTNQGSAREWQRMSRHDLDFNFIPSAMGGAVPLGVGLALAQPEKQVIVCSGDGSLLMNLGCLVTAIGSQVTNLTILLIDNGVYEVTGGQKTAASNQSTDFAGFAQSAGFATVATFATQNDWQAGAERFLHDTPGPRFAWLLAEPKDNDYAFGPACPMQEQIDRLRNALAAN